MTTSTSLARPSVSSEEINAANQEASEAFGNATQMYERIVALTPRDRQTLFFSATLGHYMGDAHVPFHAVLNYDGQLTNQHGIHARFEAMLFERYRDRLTIAPIGNLSMKPP